MKIVLCPQCENAVQEAYEVEKTSGFKRDKCGICGRKALCTGWDIKIKRESRDA